MMKNQSKTFLLILLSIIFCIACKDQNQQKGCEQFKNGKFIYKGRNVNFLIIREDSIQVEKQIGTAYYSKISIKWIDNCHYQAKLLESNFPYPDSIKKPRKKVVLTTEISSWTTKYYIYKSKIDMSSEVMIDTMWIKN
jgi:hypothetical protein